jgi:nucleoside-diphosphate-sugar epimerase
MGSARLPCPADAEIDAGMTHNKTVVFGALGLVGRAVVRALEARTDGQVIGVARRTPEFATRAEFVSLDLTDAEACRAAFAEATFADVSHIVYAALHERPELISGWRDPAQIATNAAMFENALVGFASRPGLRHVTLLQGTKAYGAHIGAMRIPGREDAPRHAGGNFYWNQEDHLRGAQQSRRWVYTIVRPQVVCGFALGSPMNMLSALGAYAALERERGEPLRFPGGAPCITQATDADLLARAIVWAGDTPGCANQTFNIANGDVMVWQEIFRRVADVFDMPVGEPRPLRLADAMPARAAEWDRIITKYRLVPHPLESLVGASWQFADAVLGYGGAPRDTVVSTVKARQFGFSDCVDTEAMFVRQLGALQAARILPR